MRRQSTSLLFCFFVLIGIGTPTAWSFDRTAFELTVDSLADTRSYAELVALAERELAAVEPTDLVGQTVIRVVLARGLSQIRLGDSALAILAQVIATEKSLTGVDRSLLADAWYHTGRINRLKRAYAVADDAYQQAIAIEQSLESPRIDAVLEAYNGYALSLRRQRNYATADSILSAAISHYAPTDTSLPNRQLRLVYLTHGRVHRAVAEYTSAAASLAASMDVMRRHDETATSTFGEALNVLGLVRQDQGRFEDAIRQFKAAYRVRTQLYGTTHRSVGSVVGNLATTHWALGNYVEASRQFHEALRIFRETLSPNHPHVAGTLNNLALVQIDQRQYRAAEANLETSRELFASIGGPESGHVALALTNLAIICRQTGRLDEAAGYYEQALLMKQAQLGPDHPEIADIYNNLGGLAMSDRRYAESVDWHQRALEIRQTKLGAEHVLTSESWMNLGQALAQVDQLDSSLACLNRAFAIRRERFGATSPWLAEIARAYGGTYRMLRQDSAASAHFADAFRIRQLAFTLNSATLSESDAINYSELQREAAEQLLSVAVDNVDTSHDNKLAITALVRTKGIVYDELVARRQLLDALPPEATESIVADLRTQRRLIARIYAAGPELLGAEYASELEQAIARANELERQLANAIDASASSVERQLPTIDAITAALPKSALLIDYLRFDYADWANDTLRPMYVAAVLQSNGEGRFVSLGEAGPIDTTIAQYRTHLDEVAAAGAAGPTDLETFNDIGKTLYNLIVAPCLPANANDVEDIIVGADGAINLVSIGTLINQSGQFVIESHRVSYVGGARDLVRERTGTSAGAGLLALGDPTFDRQPSTVCHVATMTTEREPSTYGPTLRVGQRSQLAPLPGTRRELADLETAWRAATDEPVDILVDSNASESCVRAMIAGRRIAHLATHGYYTVDSAGTDAVFNPLLRSGLYLAGATAVDSSASDDGVLTALEVTNLDLGTLEIAVLSSCETGRGDILDGEGVYGLRRSFLLSGVDLVLTALWPVSDQSTTQLLAPLYGERHDHRSFSQQLREQQLTWLANAPTPGDRHPFWWGAWMPISSGADR